MEDLEVAENAECENKFPELGGMDKEYPEIRVMDNMRNQSHYDSIALEPIDIMQANMTRDEYRGFLIGNIIKYTHRNKGDSIKDAKKIQVYARWLELMDDNTQIDEHKAMHELLKQIPQDKYTYVITDGRGGLHVAALVAYHLGITMVHTSALVADPTKVLFVDDIADTGATLLRAVCDTAVLCVRKGCRKAPTYAGLFIDGPQYINFTFQGDNHV